MSLQATIRRRTLGFQAAGRTSVEKPNGLTRSNRTKTTAASLNAKAVAATKKKLADAQKNQKIKGLSPNMNDSLQFAPQVFNRFKNPALQQNPRVVSHAAKVIEQSEKTQKSGTSTIFQMPVKPFAPSPSKPAVQPEQKPKTPLACKSAKSASPAQLSGTSQSGLPPQQRQKVKTSVPKKSVTFAPSSQSPDFAQSKSTKKITGKSLASASGNTTPISTNIPTNSASENRYQNSQTLSSELQKTIFSQNLESSGQESQKVACLPNVARDKPLPPNYKATLSRVTIAIVAMPIALVTSWILFERLVLGKERKELVPPGMCRVDENES